MITPTTPTHPTPMRILGSIDEIRAELAEAWRPLVLVPTMGALHEGHLTLVREARRSAGDDGTVVVSVFVNPKQFGPAEDFHAYPRDLERDVDLCAEAGADFVFAPPEAEIYLPDASTEVVETALSRGLCGASRPGHFAGVCTVVLKLFNIVSPDVAVFGKKDFQQVAIIRRMVRDLNLQVDVRAAETVREPDGLAMSSRNAYLSVDERRQAAAIRAALVRARERFGQGVTSADDLVRAVRGDLDIGAPLGAIDYVELVDQESLEPVATVARPALLAAAVRFRGARLIDNVELGE